MPTGAKPPFRPLDRPPAEVTVTSGGDGVLFLDCPRPLPEYPAHVLDYLDEGAAAHPDRPYLMRRTPDGGGWMPLRYGETAERMRRIAQALLDMKLTPDRPVMVLSTNTFEHVLITFAAMQVGIPVVPTSPAYSLLSRDFAKLRMICDSVNPGLIFAQNGSRYARAIAAIRRDDTIVVCAEDVSAINGAAAFADLLAAAPTPAVDAARGAQNGDTVAKILFTSGSTGTPKGALNTQRMLCSSQSMLAEISEPVDPDDPTVFLDWLPWHHTFGGNTNLHRILKAGGTLYIDDGKPTPELFTTTIRNLHEVAPTVFSTVPGAYAPLATALESDEALRRNFFSRLKSLSYGGAPLSQDLFERMQALAISETGMRIPFTTGHGMTETPLDTAVYWNTDRVGLIGLPIPGTRMKLVPHGDKYALLLKGPQVTPGYFGNDAANHAAFDDEGFFRTGDAVAWIDKNDPAQGLVFAGRTSEEFKLANGTWVNTGALRLKVLSALSPLVQDLLLTGTDAVGILAWPDMAALKRFCPELPGDAKASEVTGHPSVKAAIAEKLREHNAAFPAASTRIVRAMLLDDQPSLDKGEITDKRYINQRLALDNRQDKVRALFSERPDDTVIMP
ncbi:MAG: feruloyl-CoA synthase [Rhodospirillales bacterium]|nr:feruloyl-CoA synthase [Rhodospirillales bacterium]